MTNKYEIKRSKQYKKDFKRIVAEGRNIHKLEEVINILAAGLTLPDSYCDHRLKGNWKDFRECHIEFDWVLVYRKYKNELILFLSRTGSHTEVLNL